MKTRIGIGMGAWPFPEHHANSFFDFIDYCDTLGVDSLWFSDRIVGSGNTMEPVVTMAALAARSKKMKFGTSVLVLTVRNPVVLAKELATLDFLSNGRLLLVAGLGLEDPIEYGACGVAKHERGGRTDEAIVALRKLWSEDKASFEGRFYRFHDVVIEPRPVQKPGPPIWIGGRSEAALRRTGRLGDGWLPSAVTPEEIGRAIQAIRRYAAEAGREIPEDHYGVSIPCAIAGDREEAVRQASPFFRPRRDDVAPEEYCVFGTAEDIIRRIQQYVEVGVTKFVLRPVCPQDMWVAQVERLAGEVIHPVQTPFSKEEMRERSGAVPS